jgi:hypothetical protein
MFSYSTPSGLWVLGVSQLYTVIKSLRDFHLNFARGTHHS